jgi:GT2 family glycosyltransferase
MFKCSVIIPVYNRAAITRQCLDRLFGRPPLACDWEVIVVDDGSRDTTPDLLAGYGDRVRVLTHAQNRGFAVACNDGAATATGSHLVFLNNDTLPLAGWLDVLVHYAAAHPRAGVIGSKLLFPNGTVQHAGVVIAQDRAPRHIYLGFPADHPAVNKSRRFQIVTGACILIPRQAFDAAGGFDTAFLNSYEDVDLCLGLGELGWEVHYCHESVLFHLESISEGRGTHDDQNFRLYRERWSSRVRPDEWQYYLEDELIRINYDNVVPPYRFTISPLLGVPDDREGSLGLEQLLTLRSQEVYVLLKENILLRVAAGP